MYYPCCENKGADQLPSYCEADLCLCSRICRLLVFPWGGSFLLDQWICFKCLFDLRLTQPFYNQCNVHIVLLLIQVSCCLFQFRINAPVYYFTKLVIIHMIPPSSSGRLQEMGHKIDRILLKYTCFSNKIQNLPEMDQEFSYIFYTFFQNLPEMKEKPP